MKSPTLLFPTSTQLAMVKNVFVVATWNMRHTPPLHVHMKSLMDWRSLLVIPPLKAIYLMAHTLLLPARCHLTAYLPIERTYLWVPTIGSDMAFPLTVMTNKGCLVWCRPLNLLLLLTPADWLATSSKCWSKMSLWALIITTLLQSTTRRIKW
jgi:hypothetical protein